MLDWREEPVKWQIANRFGYWTARSAMRGWSQENVNGTLGKLDWATLFDTGLGRIEQGEFDQWHLNATRNIQGIALQDGKGNPKSMPFGWAAKMVAIYLKTTCYLDGFGRDNLDYLIHPPLDNKLVDNLRRKFGESPHLVQGLRSFSSIEGLSEVDYHACIESCQRIAGHLGCRLFEVEQFWTPTKSR